MRFKLLFKYNKKFIFSPSSSPLLFFNFHKGNIWYCLLANKSFHHKWNWVYVGFEVTCLERYQRNRCKYCSPGRINIFWQETWCRLKAQCWDDFANITHSKRSKPRIVRPIQPSIVDHLSRKDGAGLKGCGCTRHRRRYVKANQINKLQSLLLLFQRQFQKGTIGSGIDYAQNQRTECQSSPHYIGGVETVFEGLSSNCIGSGISSFHDFDCGFVPLSRCDSIGMRNQTGYLSSNHACHWLCRWNTAIVECIESCHWRRYTIPYGMVLLSGFQLLLHCDRIQISMVPIETTQSVFDCFVLLFHYTHFVLSHHSGK